MECLYHQRDNEIFYQGKRVCICYGDSEHYETNMDEAYARTELITKMLNERRQSKSWIRSPSARGRGLKP